MQAKRQKGYTSKSRGKRHEANRNQTILLYGRIGLVAGLYGLVDENLERKGWNWKTLADYVGYTRAHITKQCQAEKMDLGLYIIVMKAVDLKWQDHCQFDWPQAPVV